MVESIVENLARIAKGAQIINAQADVLTKHVADLSKFLQEQQVGVSCIYTEARYEARGESAAGRPVRCSYYLGFGKDDSGKWGIVVVCKAPKAVESAPATGPEPEETLWVRLFDSCPRDIRLGLVPFTPKVLSGLAVAVEKVAASVEASLGHLKEMERDLPKALTKSRKP